MREWWCRNLEMGILVALLEIVVSSPGSCTVQCGISVHCAATSLKVVSITFYSTVLAVLVGLGVHALRSRCLKMVVWLSFTIEQQGRQESNIHQVLVGVCRSMGYRSAD